ncbi:Cytoplasmic tRNA 2-thiolation protein 2 [Fulvia fulva]|uniref:Cytoplasmic tRNA 2-thiolation protein 2 n=1 Tax=Passalora fulva TaxID=5499 RepID=A0A9Q8P4X7_PASFU|nr:Cytoplasmic tRNA 2-thiolation protein 2 [Fulvia fulva]KAK4632153.1 Cytoplasmic tRNA 2-thiolation protein 2 [Fulvia fulva]KAK4633506.1 Cytoplasmic tRNA 2-thiolation protein 2 [Fulvia fulva]UJO13423.1 Cytoplasmic tRNA 2-thiolation protein 2 [Fulvia fulva]WPV11068.1 Cytoplasmic tRNA 2-thiolation protein 2 [Fulvia fulva]WPV26489.1 Cytoplasmic tRNA 2-thiolation protein 2 [Fulvia fulva]
MPGRVPASKPKDETLCRRCQDVEPAIVLRTEPLCIACFTKYAHTKVVKRLDTFRVRNAELGGQRKLLLPLSLDTCSLALLHILSQHLRGQIERTGRTGFKLHILHVCEQSSDLDANEAVLANVKVRYPEHDYCTLPLSQATSLEDVGALFPDVTGGAVGDDSSHQRLHQILNSVKFATARQDLARTLQVRLVVDHARREDCEAIVWSDSTTKLAERTLAETAKGRGFALPWLVADGNTPHGLTFYYPLRDLLTKEVEAYVSYMEPSMDNCIIKTDRRPIVSTKNSTIDHLMQQYFESVEQDYPSIVANVVRTTGKLKATSLEEMEQQCELCNLPLQGQSPVKSRLCYGCIRNMPQASG